MPSGLYYNPQKQCKRRCFQNEFTRIKERLNSYLPIPDLVNGNHCQMVSIYQKVIKVFLISEFDKQRIESIIKNLCYL